MSKKAINRKYEEGRKTPYRSVSIKVDIFKRFCNVSAKIASGLGLQKINHSQAMSIILDKSEK